MAASKSLWILPIGFLIVLVQLTRANYTSSEMQMSSGYVHQCMNSWFYWNNASKICLCGPSFPEPVGMHCNRTTKEVSVRIVCMTYDNATGSTAVGRCPYSDLHRSSWTHTWIPLPKNVSDLTDAMCGGVNREGLLCSQCKPGYGPAVLSYDHRCVKCSDSHLGWLLYLCLAIIPTTIFFFVILLCRVHATSAPLNLFVFACQWFTISVSFQLSDMYLPGKTKIAFGTLGTLFSLWNLDFFVLLIPPFCFIRNLSNLQVVSMGYIVAFYPLLLTAVVYVCIQQYAKGCKVFVIMWKPFAFCLSPLLRRYNWDPLSSIVHVFASFLVLSSMKILSVSRNLLQNVRFINFTFDGTLTDTDRRLLYDPALTIFGKTHFPYAVLAITTTTAFVIVPSLLLILYPSRTFQKYLNYCGISCHAVHAFADAFNGCYKNGTNGTRDCRSFAGFYLSLRVVLLTLYQARYWEHYRFTTIIICTFVLFFFATFSPYKDKIFNILDSFGLMLFSFCYCLPEFLGTVGTVCAAYTLVYFTGYVSLRIMFCCCPQKFDRFIKWVTGSCSDRNDVREDCESEAVLPDRLLHPDGYRELSGSDEMIQSTGTHNRITLSEYGSSM